MDSSFFTNNPKLNNISPEKLQFLMEMASQEKGATPKDMMSALMSASTAAKNKGVNFDSSETDLIVEVLKQNLSDSDKSKADMILSMMRKRNGG